MHAWLADRKRIAVHGMEDWAMSQEDSFAIQDGVLKRIDVARRNGTTTVRLLAVIPSALRRDLMRVYHMHPAEGAHMDGMRTYAKVRQHFWWPRMCSDILDYVKGCLVCNMGQSRVRPAAPVQPHEQPKRPFDFVAIDLLAMPRSKQGNLYAVVMVDYFSRFAIVAPAPDKTAATIIRIVMERLVLVFGRPGTLLSDQGGEFKNKAMQKLCESIGARKEFTSPYRPQADGVVERFNRTLLKLIGAYVGPLQTDWDELLPYVLYAFNNSFSRATGCTPFSIVFGREPPTSIYFDVLDATGHLRTAASPAEWREQIKMHLEDEIADLSRQYAVEATAKERAAINAKRRAIKFMPGTLVLMDTHQKLMGEAKAKLARRRRGIYVVVEHVTDVNVRLRKVADAKALKTVVHVDMVQPVLHAKGKPLVTRDIAFPGDAADKGDEEDAAGDGEDYEVESLQAMRVQRGHIEFCVQWKGYDESCNQWLREDALDCAHLVEAFAASQGDVLARMA